MSQVATMTAREAAERFIAVFRDYAAKFSAMNERAADVVSRLRHPAAAVRVEVMECTRLICLKDTLEKAIAAVTQAASDFLKQAELEQVVGLELKLRLDELEEHLHFANVVASELRRELSGYGDTREIRKLVEENRSKVPF